LTKRGRAAFFSNYREAASRTTTRVLVDGICGRKVYFYTMESSREEYYHQLSSYFK
jgi:hypothetical protein